MDEKQISELLECSVCLERLDQTCKVLPCQHTFCRRCLDEILLTKQELRCPECRALVTVRVSDLPTNILVVRILEGLKTKGQRPAGGGGRVLGSINLNSSPLKLGVSSPHHRLDPGLNHLYRQGSQPCVRALYNYDSSEKDDLQFKKGDIILLRRQIDDNWYHGELASRQGFFPANFVQVLVPLPQIPQCRAMYDFDLQDEGEKDCLSFKKEEVLTVIRRVDENWLEGRKGDKIGIFPITFVELNDAARSLINTKSNLTILPSSSSTSSGPITATSSVSAGGTTSLTSSSRNTTNNSAMTSTATTSISSGHSDSAVMGEGVLAEPPPPSSISASSPQSSSEAPIVSNGGIVPESPPVSSSSSSPSSSAELGPASSISASEVLPQNKRHSYTSSSLSSPVVTTTAVTQSHQRHSAEVTVSTGGALTLVSTDVTAISTLTAPSSPSSSSTTTTVSTETQLTTSSSQNNTRTLIVSQSDTNTDTPPSSSSSAAGMQSGSLTAPLYIALYNYKPQKEDELELHKGEQYTVAEKCQDGWYKGTCVKTNQAGVFPGNYVHMVRHSSAFKPVNPNVLNIRAKGPSPSSSLTLSAMTIDQRPVPPVPASAEASSQAPPLMPRVAKMSTSGQKSRSPSSQLVGGPHRSLSSPATTTLLSSPKHMLPSTPTTPSSSHNSTHASLSRPMIPAPPPSTVASPHRSLWVPPNLMAMQQTMSASANITPPNVVVAHSFDSPSAALTTSGKEKKEKKEKEKKSLVKLLAGKTKKSKQAPPDPEPGPPLAVLFFDNVAHVSRSGSYPADSSAGHSTMVGGDTSTNCAHRKAASFDATTTTPPVPAKPRPKPMVRERYRCVVPYPPQTDHELALELGDIIHVHRKREDGWYKGTQERTGKTGMFPATFVVKCD